MQNYKANEQYVPTTNVGSGGKYARFVAVSYYTTCIILNDNTAKCYGRNNGGQLLRGNTADVGASLNDMGDNLASISFGVAVTTIVAGTEHFCALFVDNSTKCWG